VLHHSVPCLAAGEGFTPKTGLLQFEVCSCTHCRFCKATERYGLPFAGVAASRLAPFVLAFILLPFAGRLRRADKRLSRMLSVLLLVTTAMATVAVISGCVSTSGFFAQ
jgi:hypothetical protein